MGTYTIVPTTAGGYALGQYKVYGGVWTATGGTLPALFSDNSPAPGGTGGTYTKTTTASGTCFVAYDMSDPSIPGTEVVRRIRAVGQVIRPTTTSKCAIQLASILSAPARTYVGAAWTTTTGSATTATALYSGWLTTMPDGSALTAAKCNTLLAILIDTATTAGARTQFSELAISIETVSIPTVTVTTPSGSVTDATSPLIAWTYADADSEAQTDAQVIVYTSAQYGAGGFVAGTSAGVWSSGSQGTALAAIPPALTNGTTYKAYVRVAKSMDGKAVWSGWTAGPAFTISVIAPAAPLLFATWSTPSQSASLGATGTVNMLTANQAGLESGTTGWVTAGSNCTASQSSTMAYAGSYSLRLSSTAAGPISTTTLAGTSGVRVNVGTTYTAVMQVRAGSVARSTNAGIVWYDSGGSVLSTSNGTAANDATGSWTQFVCTAAAPANAVYAAANVYVSGTGGAAELHYVDAISVHPGSGTAWNSGGVASHSIKIERSDDGGTTWAAVRNGSGDAMNPGQAFAVSDYEAPRGTSVKYRAASTVVVSGAEIQTAWTTSAAIPTTSDSKWWLKAMESPSLNRNGLEVQAGLSTSVESDVGVFRPLDSAVSMVVSGAVFGEDGEITIHCPSETAWVSDLRPLYRWNGTLLMQDPLNRQKYVRIEKRSVKEEYSGGTVHRMVTIGFYEVGF